MPVPFDSGDVGPAGTVSAISCAISYIISYALAGFSAISYALAGTGAGSPALSSHARVQY
eukprot:1538642-Rhodomonas_salina.1